MVARDGGIFSFGNLPFCGSTGSLTLNAPIVGMAQASNTGGYWLVASDGGVFAFNGAGFYGSMGGQHLNKPIVGIAATPDGRGYWLVASDGGIFTFGDAQYWGSTGNLVLNSPVVGMAAAPDGLGYRLVASDGGVFTFGDAQYFGSAGSPDVEGTGRRHRRRPPDGRLLARRGRRRCVQLQRAVLRVDGRPVPRRADRGHERHQQRAGLPVRRLRRRPVLLRQRDVPRDRWVAST